MFTDVVVTDRKADGLRCPFTGNRLVVHMVVHPGSIVFNAPDAFTLAEPVDGLDTLFMRASMRNGVSGAAPVEGPVRDPYTGETLTLKTLPDGRVCYVGGFNPRAACESLDRFVYMASMRDGRTDMPPPAEFVVEKPGVSRCLKHKSIDVSQDTVAAAEAAVDKAGLVKKSVRGASIRRKGDVS